MRRNIVHVSDPATLPYSTKNKGRAEFLFLWWVVVVYIYIYIYIKVLKYAQALVRNHIEPILSYRTGFMRYADACKANRLRFVFDQGCLQVQAPGRYTCTHRAINLYYIHDYGMHFYRN